MLCAVHRSRVSAPFLEKPTRQSVAADVDAVLASVAKDVTFCAGGTAEAELSELGAAVFDGSCSIAESQIHGSNGYPDEWGDNSDQPFTFLSALEGDFVFVLHDDGAGYSMAVRSASGRSPLFWGADEAGDYALFSTSPAGRLSAFPQGCAFESQVEEDGAENRVVDFRRHTRSARPVRTVPRVDSKGHLCGLMCTSKSGRDLVEMQQPSDVY